MNNSELIMDAVELCIAPIWTSIGIDQNPSTVKTNGTCVFVDTGEKKLILTNHHVFDHYRRTLQSEPKAGLAINLGPSVTPFLDNPVVLDEDKEIDLTVIEWNDLEKWRGHNKRFFIIRDWPIPKPKEKDPITIVGFPGQLRKGFENHGSFSPFGLGMTVCNPPLDNVWLVDETGTLKTYTNGSISQESIDLGGLSGSPGFFFDGTKFQLAGLVYECNPSGDMVALNLASKLNRDGTINRV